MEQNLIEFIKDNGLDPFNQTKTRLTRKEKSIFKTPEARNIFRNTLSVISKSFVFPETPNLFNSFHFTQDKEEIEKRQEFFKNLKSKGKLDNSFLNSLEKPSPKWKPDYDVIVVTEDTSTYNELKRRGCPAQMLLSESDISSLQDNDVVQVINAEEFSSALESLPQSIFLNSIDEAYLERHLETISAWENNLKILNDNDVKGQLGETVNELLPLLKLVSKEKEEKITYEGVKSKVEEINEKINERAKDISVSGESLVGMLNKGELPEEIKNIVHEEIKKAQIPEDVINIKVPLSIDEQNLQEVIKRQESEENTKEAEQIKSNKDFLKEVPSKIEDLSNNLLLYDFLSGVSQFIQDKETFPEISQELSIEESRNHLIDNPQPISFHLTNEERCSILTGANSGGKTTLIEHLLQVISLTQLGLPVSGNGSKVPVFEELYYFAKNKGAISKGAFENLLDQMSKIPTQNDSRKLILADEIESVTEPGVAGNIIGATIEYFVKQNCFMVIATHLGHEIKPRLPEKSRIDGIEAKGLDKNFELMVDHNPVKGRLANSTPELIVERLANNEQNEYYHFLNRYLKEKND